MQTNWSVSSNKSPLSPEEILEGLPVIISLEEHDHSGGTNGVEIPFENLIETPTTWEGYGITNVAPIEKGVTNGDNHDHSGGDGADIPFSSIVSKPTTLGGYGITDAAPIEKGVTNGDNHDHNGGDGGTVAFSSLGSIPTTISGYGITDGVTLTGTESISNKTLASYKENIITLTHASPMTITASDAPVQAWDPTTNVTATINISAGESLLLVILSTTRTITWSNVTWVNGNVAPTLSSSGRTFLALWAVDGSNVYGSNIGKT